jgi:GT2 family glycosyltransferase/glycosyltransferase involved in cell wall biosynthesis
MSLVVDPIWYRARHRDVAASGVDPLRHFIDAGLREWRDPNRWFDSAWYVRQNADVAASGTHPLLHYMSEGAKQGRDPHPRFDAGWYGEQHPEASGNPMLFHLRVGAARGWLTERPVTIEDYLPSDREPLADRRSVAVDVIIPVYRGLEFTRSCIESVLADTGRPTGRVIVIDDRSPEPKLRAWLDRLAKTGAITLLRNKRNLGFVASVNLGIRRAGDRDVALLNSDSEVPAGWLSRLRAQAYAAANIASVSPLSNNATVCSYLGYEGAPVPPGMTLAGIDAACRAINTGRYAATPTTVGFCMYIRRAALDEVGLFDTKTFGKGYGEENDFCLRATKLGWRHHIACDTFVRHEGGASFGAAADAGISRAYALLTRRYPDYSLRIAQFVHDAETEPFRFAITMSLFRTSGLPTILVLSHNLDGGVRRHVHDIVERDAGRANYLVLEPASRGLALSVPALPGHPKLVLAAERWRDVAEVARSAGVTRVHIHHLMGLDLDVRALIFELGVKFDVTVHDYFAICPQVTLLPWSAGPYCGEPGPAGCDACIAHRPSHGATDILSWRLLWAWQFHEAERVFAPSQDALDRLRRHGVGARARLVPHEPVVPGPWPLRPPTKPRGRLRVAVLGVLANHKGAQLVASVAMAADPAKLELQLIGDTEATFPDAARDRMTIHGQYREGELLALLIKYRPHAVWFPAAWPETYSFTLSAAIEAGLPIVANEIGAFPERLAGRPLTWLIPPTLDPAVWLTLFDTLAETLGVPRSSKQRVVQTRPGGGSPDASEPNAGSPGGDGPGGGSPGAELSLAASVKRARRRGPVLVDLRRDDVTAVIVVPEAYDDYTAAGSYTPCAHIRLLRPLDHPVAGGGLATTLADAGSACRYHADVIVTQRHAVPSMAAAVALAAHAKRTGAALIYDLDDDLLTIPPDHPEAAELAPKAAVVEQMIRRADIVRTSTAALAARIAPLARWVEVAGNALDERIWLPCRHGRTDGYGPVRILCMGTTTHDADFALLSPALTEIHRQFGDQIQVELIGFVSKADVPTWIRRLAPTPHAIQSYPAFVHWLNWAGPWDIGLAPLADSPFNVCKSPIKVLDYAAMGLATLASDVAAYQGSLADGPGGELVPGTTAAWYEALSRLIRDAGLRRRLAEDGARHFQASGTLASQADAWRRAWPGATNRKSPAEV